ncbi:MAG: T9SS type A sorting domain-containing protein [Bacteroidales bacterium]|nr:T9SS type A sorting domain-containing protein [Bacteroidales bacterium]
MTFSDEDLKIVYTSGSIQPYAIAGIRKIYFYEPTAITELTGVSRNGLLLYPNPVSTRLTIQGIPAGTTQVDLFNLTGMRVLSILVEDDSPVIDVTGLKPGLYVLKASHLTAKFIKQ